ncbi:MAG: hypothetical protein O7C59_00610 [Rickettsia endosymbiont of Ixodes persulcatus]|nr:hypothetical protein [Rickettsia endosymbiont of Ixodes persulcatus]
MGEFDVGAGVVDGCDDGFVEIGDEVWVMLFDKCSYVGVVIDGGVIDAVVY